MGVAGEREILEWHAGICSLFYTNFAVSGRGLARFSSGGKKKKTLRERHFHPKVLFMPNPSFLIFFLLSIIRRHLREKNQAFTRRSYRPMTDGREKAGGGGAAPCLDCACVPAACAEASG